MVDEFTDNYGFFIPKPADSMADVRKNITNTFETIAPVAEPTIISAGNPLPQVGDYNIGDIVFRDDPDVLSDYPSSYILTSQDSDWGWYWRPIQKAIAPWFALSVDNISNADFDYSTSPGLRISQDYFGNCHWRGCITYVPGAGGIPIGKMDVFKLIPEGIRPNIDIKFTCGVSPVASASLNKYMGAVIDIRSDGTSFIRTFGTDNGVAKVIWFDGLVYNNAREHYYAP